MLEVQIGGLIQFRIVHGCDFDVSWFIPRNEQNLIPLGQIGADGLDFVIVPPGRKLPGSSRGPQVVPGVYVLKKVSYVARV